MDEPNEDSRLWISLDDAVEQTGTSRRNIGDWIREGKIKKEKRKGKTYIWVEDLIKCTPLQSAPSTPSAEAEVLPDHFQSDSIGNSIGLARKLSEQLKDGEKLQNEILLKVNELEHQLSAHPQQLAPETVKELSVLGNVFRSVHQQNEKVTLALASHEQLLKDAFTMNQREDELRKELRDQENSSRKLTGWLLLCIGLGLSAGLFLWLTFERDLEEQVAHVENKNKEIAEKKHKIETQENIIESKTTQIEEIRKVHSNDLSQLNQQHNSEMKNLQQSHKTQRQEWQKTLDLAQAAEKRDRDRLENMIQIFQAKAVELEHQLKKDNLNASKEMSNLKEQYEKRIQELMKILENQSNQEDLILKLQDSLTEIKKDSELEESAGVRDQ